MATLSRTIPASELLLGKSRYAFAILFAARNGKVILEWKGKRLLGFAQNEDGQHFFQVGADEFIIIPPEAVITGWPVVLEDNSARAR